MGETVTRARMEHRLATMFHNDEIGPRTRLAKRWMPWGASQRGWLWHRVRWVFVVQNGRGKNAVVRFPVEMKCGASFHHVCFAEAPPPDARLCARCSESGVVIMGRLRGVPPDACLIRGEC
jgi:hypothetical protein